MRKILDVTLSIQANNRLILFLLPLQKVQKKPLALCKVERLGLMFWGR